MSLDWYHPRPVSWFLSHGSPRETKTVSVGVGTSDSPGTGHQEESPWNTWPGAGVVSAGKISSSPEQPQFWASGLPQIGWGPFPLSRVILKLKTKCWIYRILSSKLAFDRVTRYSSHVTLTHKTNHSPWLWETLFCFKKRNFLQIPLSVSSISFVIPRERPGLHGLLSSL